MRLTTRFTILIPMAVAVLLALQAGILWRSDKGEAVATTREILTTELLAAARTGAAFLNGDLHAHVSDTLDPSGWEFVELRAALRSVAQSNGLGEETCYTFARPAPGTDDLRFAVMLDATPYTGEVYRIPPANRSLIERLVREKTAVATDIYEDENGTWLSAMAPILASDGKIAGILELDHTAEEVMRGERVRLWQRRRVLLTQMAIVSVGALALLLPFLARAINALQSRIRDEVAAITRSSTGMVAELTRELATERDRVATKEAPREVVPAPPEAPSAPSSAHAAPPVSEPGGGQAAARNNTAAAEILKDDGSPLGRAAQMLMRVEGEEKARALVAECLATIGLASGPRTPQELLLFAEWLVSRGGFTEMVGRSLRVQAYLAGAGPSRGAPT